MLSQDHLEDLPVKQRPGSANNLPGAKAKKPGWNTPVMRAAKLMIWRFALLRAGSEERLIARTDWAVIGVTEAALLAEVRRLIPCFDEEWTAQGRKGGDASKAKALYGRLWHMYRRRDKQGEVHEELTVEHPTRSKRLKPYTERARQAYIRNRPMSRATLTELFS